MQKDAPQMNADDFWRIIDSVHDASGGNMDRKCDLLRVRLDKLNDQDLRDFIDHFDAADAKAYTWPLWGAAYVMNGGCSDDAFSDFRATLISLGRNVYEAALSDPDSLADLDFEDEEDICYEGFQYVKNEVAEARFDEIPEMRTSFPSKPSGEEWDEETVCNLYPRLSVKYGYSEPNQSGDDGGDTDSDDDRQPKKPWWKLW
jgi:hypothetical protein